VFEKVSASFIEAFFSVSLLYLKPVKYVISRCYTF